MTVRRSGGTTVLLTGVTGQLGSALAPLLARAGRVVAPARAELDLSNPAEIRAAVEQTAPNVIVNAAAYTAVDRAESDRDACFAVNANAPGELARAAASRGAAVVHFSTDYVFDGSKHAPYVEDDLANPVNVYGESKLAGERAVTASGGRSLIIRTGWLYSPAGTNFVRTMLRLAREREELCVVNDQAGSPTSAAFVAQASVTMLEQMLKGVAPWGTYHVAAGGQTTWYEFARAILERDPRRSEHRVVRVIPITTAEYPTAARRPAYSVLDCSKARERCGITLADWREQLRVAHVAG